MFNTVGFFAKTPILIAASAAIILFDSLIGKLFAPKEKRKEMEKGYIFAFIPLLLLVLLGAISLKASLTVTTQAQDWYKSVRTEQTAKDMHIEGPYLVFDKVGTEYYPKLRHYGTGDVDCLPLLRFLTDDCKTVLVISKSEVAHSATYGSASGSRIRQMRLTVDVYDRQSGKRMGSFTVLGASVPNSIGNSGDRDNYPPYRDVIKAAEEYAEAHNRY